ncbi:hypothetical protein ACFL4Z_03535 [candidate division KSB1 bacterium]
MEASDYYCLETTTSKIGYSLGRGTRVVRTVIIKTTNPLKVGAAVGVVWGGIVALINARKYKQGSITKRDAVLDTASESVGMGLAAGLGLLASNMVRASVIVASTSSIIPFTLSVVVTTGAKVIWNCNTKRNLKCEEKRLQQQRKPAVPASSSA